MQLVVVVVVQCSIYVQFWQVIYDLQGIATGEARAPAAMAAQDNLDSGRSTQNTRVLPISIVGPRIIITTKDFVVKDRVSLGMVHANDIPAERAN